MVVFISLRPSTNCPTDWYRSINLGFGDLCFDWSLFISSLLALHCVAFIALLSLPLGCMLQNVPSPATQQRYFYSVKTLITWNIEENSLWIMLTFWELEMLFFQTYFNLWLHLCSFFLFSWKLWATRKPQNSPPDCHSVCSLTPETFNIMIAFMIYVAHQRLFESAVPAVSLRCRFTSL